MRSVTVYEAEDGSRWNTEDKAMERDGLILLVAARESTLRPRPSGPGARYSSGNGYLQHPPGTRTDLAGWLTDHGWNRDSQGPIGKLGWRVHCMDDHDREWGQPYFALNPDKGEQVEVSRDVAHLNEEVAG